MLEIGFFDGSVVFLRAQSKKVEGSFTFETEVRY